MESRGFHLIATVAMAAAVSLAVIVIRASSTGQLLKVLAQTHIHSPDVVSLALSLSAVTVFLLLPLHLVRPSSPHVKGEVRIIIHTVAGLSSVCLHTPNKWLPVCGQRVCEVCI